MNAPLRSLARALLPRPLRRWLTRHQRLRFTGPYPDWPAALDASTGAPHVVLLSSVLSYVEHPWPILGRLAALPAAAWIVTRTCFSDTPADRVIVQQVPASIYRASYPAWVFAEEKYRRFWSERGASLSWHATVEGEANAGPLQFAFKNVLILPRGAPQETASTTPPAL